MDISESYTLHASREQVWDALLAADTLKQSVPGCDSLEQTGDDAYAVHMNVTVPEISGVYDGTLRLLDVLKPETFRMVVDSAGARGTLHSDTALRLEAKDAATTVVHCSGQARLGGALASVGAEAAEGTASKMIRQSLDQLASMLPESSSVPTKAELPLAPASISLPAEAERPARRRRTTNSRSKDQQATKEADQPPEQNTAATMDAPSPGATPRRRGGNSRQRSRKADVAGVADVAEQPDPAVIPDSAHIAPTEEVAPLPAASANSGSGVEASLAEQPSATTLTPPVADATPPPRLDMTPPLAARETAEPAIVPPSTGEQAAATSARPAIPRLRPHAAVIDLSAMDSQAIQRGSKTANLLGVAIAVTSMALTALLVWLLAGGFH